MRNAVACLQVRNDSAVHFGSSNVDQKFHVTVGGGSGVIDTGFRGANSVLRFFFMFEQILEHSF